MSLPSRRSRRLPGNGSKSSNRTPILTEREKLVKWKVSKGEKSGKEKSQETGTVREEGKSGKRQHQETGKVRKSLRIRCRHRNPCVYSEL